MNIMLVCFHALGSNAQYAYLITFVVTLKRNRGKSFMNEILVSYFNDIYWWKNMDKNNINENTTHKDLV